MWESISNILTSPNALQTIVSIILILLIVVVMIKTGMIRIRTKHVQVGNARISSDTERKIIQEQCEFTRAYLNGLIGKITEACPDHKLMYDGWFTRCILSDAYDEFVKWITQNHISDNKAYVSTKQNKICALIYSYPVRSVFKTPEFQTRMKNWVEEIIRELVRIRKVYTEQAKEAHDDIGMLCSEI